jgi:hypothetical protein
MALLLREASISVLHLPRLGEKDLFDQKICPGFRTLFLQIPLVGCPPTTIRQRGKDILNWFSAQESIPQRLIFNWPGYLLNDLGRYAVVHAGSFRVGGYLS